MSAIHFHSQDQTVDVSGRERGWMGRLCADMLESAIGPVFDSKENPDWTRRMLPADAFPLSDRGPRYADTLKLYLRNSDKPLTIDDETLSTFTLQLNTALAAGSDHLKLCARLHGQCEIHCYVEGVNRGWLAGIIERATDAGVLRAWCSHRGDESGWDAVVRMLRKNCRTPVVCSYSVCRQFPNGDVAGWKDDRDGDGWYDLPKHEQWARALAALRKSSETRRLELKPDDWDTYRFGNGTTGFDLYRMVWASHAHPHP